MYVFESLCARGHVQVISLADLARQDARSVSVRKREGFNASRVVILKEGHFYLPRSIRILRNRQGLGVDMNFEGFTVHSDRRREVAGDFAVETSRMSGRVQFIYINGVTMETALKLRCERELGRCARVDIGWGAHMEYCRQAFQCAQGVARVNFGEHAAPNPLAWRTISAYA